MDSLRWLIGSMVLLRIVVSQGQEYHNYFIGWVFDAECCSLRWSGRGV